MIVNYGYSAFGINPPIVLGLEFSRVTFSGDASIIVAGLDFTCTGRLHWDAIGQLDWEVQ